MGIAASSMVGSQRNASHFGSSDSLPADIAFLSESEVSAADLQAAAISARSGLAQAHEHLIASGKISADRYAHLLGATLGIRTNASHCDLLLPRDVDASFRYGLVRFIDENGTIGLLMGLDPAHVRSLTRGGFDQHFARLIIVSRSRFETLYIEAFGSEVDDIITNQLKRRTPHLSADNPVTAMQACLFTAAIFLFYELVLMAGAAVFWVLMAVLLLSFVPAIVMQAASILFSRKASPRPDPLRASELPIYTILAPLHGEAAVAGDLVEALDAINYPRTLLDIIFLIEDDDHLTMNALRQKGLKPHMRILSIPGGAVRTKPRALNLGLWAARGSCITVYDAEDAPHPDQLKAAAAYLAGADSTIACVQAPLLIDNTDSSWISRMFAFEYAGLFLVLKPGIGRLGLPLPLGGTSNHFRTDLLRKLGGWDARNVTEDADLGLRLYRYGHAIATIEEPTYEEAPCTLKAWMGQRRRWLKGWYQTALVHTRKPRLYVKDAGLVRASIGSMVAGTQALAPILFPLSFVYVLGHAFGIWLLGEDIPPTEFLGWAILPLAAHGLALLALAIGSKRAGYQGWILAALLWPIYLMLIALAGLLAVSDFMRKPFHWRKTAHGLASRQPGRTQAARVSAKAGTAASNAPSQATSFG